MILKIHIKEIHSDRQMKRDCKKNKRDRKKEK